MLPQVCSRLSQGVCTKIACTRSSTRSRRENQRESGSAMSLLPRSRHLLQPLHLGGLDLNRHLGSTNCLLNLLVKTGCDSLCNVPMKGTIVADLTSLCIEELAKHWEAERKPSNPLGVAPLPGPECGQDPVGSFLWAARDPLQQLSFGPLRRQVLQ